MLIGLLLEEPGQHAELLWGDGGLGLGAGWRYGTLLGVEVWHVFIA